MEKDLNNRLFAFAVLIIRILRKLPESSEFRFLKNQLARAATSAGANYEEAQGGSSYRDFTYKAEIALREMREANYWLRLMKESGDYPT